MYDSLIKTTDLIMRKIQDELTKSSEIPMVFFVGAGISIPSGLPGFNNLNRTIIELTTIQENKKEIDFLSKNLRPEIVFQVLKDNLDETVVDCFGELIGFRPNANHFFLAKALEEGNWVFTTNQDNLIEQACRELEIDIENKVYIDEWDYKKFSETLKMAKTAQEIPKGCLFKLHGSIEEDKIDSERFKTILTSLRDIGRKFNDYKTNVLKHFIENFNFCFMGYSCRDDFSIYPILQNTPSTKSIIWFEFDSNPISEIIWNHNRFQKELEFEYSKPILERDWGKININSILLRRGWSCKIVGNSSKFIEDSIVLIISKNVPAPKPVKNEKFLKWAKCIGIFKRNLIMGLLWDKCWNGEKAIYYFKNAIELSGSEEEKAIAYLMMGRVYSRQFGKSSGLQAFECYEKSFEHFENSGQSYGKALVKIDLGNIKRRDYKNYPEAKEDIELAIKILESIDHLEERDLDYAGALNVLGLIHYGLKDDLELSKNLCKRSLEIKKKYGDIDGEAESENAIGLTLKEQKKIPEAISCLKRAVDCRERIGNYRGCAQQYRNLGLCYLDLRDYSTARHCYEQSEFNWLRVRQGRPPINEIAEIKFRLGELDTKMGHKDSAISNLRQAIQIFKQLNDWNNEGRCLNLLIDCYSDQEDLKPIFSETFLLYNKVLSNENKIKEMQNAKIRYTNSIEHLNKIASLIDTVYSSHEAVEIKRKTDKLMEDINKAFGST
ncbi:MAG: tetratricopeptide repeat protein [Methanosarcina vacuolata]|jgi:tetratricopeptide (TPR) repeat protein|nr:tetratricopeptide repeat protein [Methanosarcina vacuolata]